MFYVLHHIMPTQHPLPFTPPAEAPVESLWQLLLRRRWWLGGAMGGVFAVGRTLEAIFLREATASLAVILDVVLGGCLGWLAVWGALLWASRQEQRHQSELEQILRQQQRLNQQLQRANGQLALLSEVNRSLAASASLDEILDGALLFPQRLAPSQAAVLWLHDASEAILARTTGVTAEQLTGLRAPFISSFQAAQRVQSVTAPADPDSSSCA
jgi:hypothetical protein